MKRVWYTDSTVAGMDTYHVREVSDAEAEAIGAVMHWKEGPQGEYRFATPCKQCGDLAFSLARLYPLLTPTRLDSSDGPYCPACMQGRPRAPRVKIVPYRK